MVLQGAYLTAAVTHRRQGRPLLDFVVAAVVIFGSPTAIRAADVACVWAYWMAPRVASAASTYWWSTTWSMGTGACCLPCATNQSWSACRLSAFTRPFGSTPCATIWANTFGSLIVV